MSEKKKAPRLVLYFRPWEPSQYDSSTATHYTLHLMLASKQAEENGPLNISRCSHEYDHPGIGIFEDFELRCYISWGSGQFYADGFAAGYRGYMIMDRIDEAEQMVKGLKFCKKIRDAFPIQPTTFGQYVALMAASLGVKEVCRKRDPRHNGYSWQYLPLSYAQEWIDEEIARVRKLKTGQEEAA